METSSLINQAPLPRISPLPLAGPSHVVHPFPLPGNAHVLPVEILSEIFQITEPWTGVNEGKVLQHKKNLMLVCRHWYAIMLSTPGITSTLRIRRATQKEVIQTFLQARTRWLIDVIVDMNDITDGNDFNADNLHASIMAAAQATSRWRSLRLISLRSEGEFESLHILQSLKQSESFELAQGFGMFFDLLTTSHYTKMKFANPVAVPYLIQPACLHISHSLVTLRIYMSKRMGSPVDILPHLQRLETFVAHHLFLPIYPPDASLPLIKTLSKLDLKSVSVQWMAGRIFPLLWKCSIISPHHAGAIQVLRPVTMHSCGYLTYTSNDLSPLTHFHPLTLFEMNVKSGQWSVWRGDAHLLAVHHIFVTSAQSLTGLDLAVKCSEQLLVYILSLLPKLEILSLHLASPNALSGAFFQAFILERPSPVGGSEVARLPRKAIAPLCISLWHLRLYYQRWLRGADKQSLLLTFAEIAESRELVHEEISWKFFELSLGFEEPDEGQFWIIGAPVHRALKRCLVFAIKFCGISSMITISTPWPWSDPIPLPFKEVEYLQLLQRQDDRPIDLLHTHDHMELIRYDSNQQRPATPLLCNLPLFDELRVMVLKRANPSFLAGHTFPKLERCRVETSHEVDDITDYGLFTEMPVCTTLDINDLIFLSTFNLPRIHELAVEITDLKGNMIWEKQIAANTNLSGLKLLHLKCWPFHGNLDQILRPLRSLETLIINFPMAEWIGPVLSLWAPVVSGLKQPSSEGHSPAILCPMLQSLQIEDAYRSMIPELIPVLKDIVTLRAVYGSPLKSFTLYTPNVGSGSNIGPGSIFELIGSDGSFTMEETVLGEDAGVFKLDI